MAKKIEAVFTANTTGLKKGIGEASSMFTGLKSTIAGLGAIAGLVTLTNAVKNLAEKADDMDKLATRIGITASELQTLSNFARQGDMTFESLGASMNGMIKTLGDMTKMSDDQSDAFKRIGLDAKDMQKLNSADRYKAITIALAGVTNQTTRESLALKLLGKQAKESFALISTGQDDLKEKFKNAELMPKISDESVKVFAELNEQMREGGGLVQALSMDFLAPSIKVIVEEFKKAQGILSKMHSDGTISKWGNELSYIVKQVASIFGGLMGFIKGKSLWHVLLDLAVLRGIMKIAGGIISSSFSEAFKKQSTQAPAPNVPPTQTSTGGIPFAITGNTPSRRGSGKIQSLTNDLNKQMDSANRQAEKSIANMKELRAKGSSKGYAKEMFKYGEEVKKVNILHKQLGQEQIKSQLKPVESQLRENLTKQQNLIPTNTKDLDALKKLQAEEAKLFSTHKKIATQPLIPITKLDDFKKQLDMQKQLDSQVIKTNNILKSTTKTEVSGALSSQYINAKKDFEAAKAASKAGYRDINRMKQGYATPYIKPNIDFAPVESKFSNFKNTVINGFKGIGASIGGILANPMIWVMAVYAGKQYFDFLRQQAADFEAEMRDMMYANLDDQKKILDAVQAGLDKRYSEELDKLNELKNTQGIVLDAALGKIEKQVQLVSKLRNEYEDLGKSVEDYGKKITDIDKEIGDKEKQLAEVRSKHKKDEADAIRKTADTMRTAWGKAKDVMGDMDDISTEMLEKLAKGDVAAFRQLRAIGQAKSYGDAQKAGLKSMMAGKRTVMSDQQQAQWFKPMFGGMLGIRKMQDQANRKEFGFTPRNKDEEERARNQMSNTEMEAKNAEEIANLQSEISEKTKERIKTEELWKKAVDRQMIVTQQLAIAINQLNESLAGAENVAVGNKDLEDKLKAIRTGMLTEEQKMVSDLFDFSMNLSQIQKDIAKTSKEIKAQEEIVSQAKERKEAGTQIIKKQKDMMLEKTKKGEIPQEAMKMFGLNPEEINTVEQMSELIKKYNEVQGIKKTDRSWKENIPMFGPVEYNKQSQTGGTYTVDEKLKKDKIIADTKQKIRLQNIEEALIRTKKEPTTPPKIMDLSPSDQAVKRMWDRQDAGNYVPIGDVSKTVSSPTVTPNANNFALSPESVKNLVPNNFSATMPENIAKAQNFEPSVNQNSEILNKLDKIDNSINNTTTVPVIGTAGRR